MQQRSQISISNNNLINKPKGGLYSWNQLEVKKICKTPRANTSIYWNSLLLSRIISHCYSASLNSILVVFSYPPYISPGGGGDGGGSWCLSCASSPSSFLKWMWCSGGGDGGGLWCLSCASSPTSFLKWMWCSGGGDGGGLWCLSCASSPSSFLKWMWCSGGGDGGGLWFRSCTSSPSSFLKSIWCSGGGDGGGLWCRSCSGSTMTLKWIWWSGGGDDARLLDRDPFRLLPLEEASSSSREGSESNLTWVWGGGEGGGLWCLSCSGSAMTLKWIWCSGGGDGARLLGRELSSGAGSESNLTCVSGGGDGGGLWCRSCSGSTMTLKWIWLSGGGEDARLLERDPFREVFISNSSGAGSESNLTRVAGGGDAGGFSLRSCLGSDTFGKWTCPNGGGDGGRSLNGLSLASIASTISAEIDTFRPIREGVNSSLSVSIILIRAKAWLVSIRELYSVEAIDQSRTTVAWVWECCRLYSICYEKHSEQLRSDIAIANESNLRCPRREREAPFECFRMKELEGVDTLPSPSLHPPFTTLQ